MDKCPSRLEQLEAFFEEMFQRVAIDSGDVDSFDAIESMERHGLVTTEPYDPRVHGEIEEAEPGDAITVRVKR